MSLKYYDYDSGRERYKRRYVWGIHGYALGMATGLALLYLLR
ncbi:hypothetical protein [Solimonas fluminis]|nr:hypothetical protein [Solimonas fluminis]